MMEDAESQAEVVCFPRQWPYVTPLLAEGSPSIVRGTVRNEEETSIILDELEPLQDVRSREYGAVRIRIRADGLPDGFFDSLGPELSKFPGSSPVMLEFQTQDSQALLRMRSVKVSLTPELAGMVQSISMGHASVVS
jgi:DNA polymerase III alpha subunit